MSTKSTKSDKQAEFDALEAARADAPDRSLDELPVTENVWPGPHEPVEVAGKLVEQRSQDGHPMIKYWRGGWHLWVGSHWAEAEGVEIDALLYHELRRANFETVDAEGNRKARRWLPNKTKVGQVEHALAAYPGVLLGKNVDQPVWTAPGPQMAPGALAVSVANGLLELPLRKVHAHTPRYFNAVALPFAYEAAALEPEQWLRFLDQIFGGDQEAIESLKMWFGYVISGRTDLQKMLLLGGAPRSGKGTIANVLRALVGAGNCAGPSLSSFAQNFGLAPLLGKSLAVIADARLDNRTDTAQITERLLAISGGDAVDVDRKHRDGWHGKLPARIMIMSNELPRLNDASGAIASRYIVITTKVSFLGREDHALSDKLVPELPGILNWALDGLDLLNARGHLSTPQASADAVRDLEDLTSPIKAFLRDCCEDGGEVECRSLFKAWEAWAQDNGQYSGSSATFGRNLRAARPEIQVVQPRTDVGSRVRKYFGLCLNQPLPVPTTPYLPVPANLYGSTPGGQN